MGQAMIASVDGKRVKIFKSDGTLVRIIQCTKGASVAYINGDKVNIQFDDGTVAIYTVDGSLIRYIK